MKKIILAISILIATTTGYSQTIQTATYSGVKIIYPTLMNITGLMTMTYVQFNELCRQYNYTLSQYPDMYISHLPVGSPLFYISKTPSKASIMWTDEGLDISTLKDELQPYFEESDGDKQIYAMTIDGKKYHIFLRNISLSIFLIK